METLVSAEYSLAQTQKSALAVKTAASKFCQGRLNVILNKII